MWCMFPTMLMATNDVRLRDPDIEAILLNNETIAVNRTPAPPHRTSTECDLDESGLLIICAGWPEDPWGLSAFRINAGTNAGRSDLGSDPRLPTQLQWARHLANGDIAALILNRDNATQHATLKFADFLPGVAGGAYHVRDLQARKDLGVKCQSVSFVLPPHETTFVNLWRQLTNINDTCCPRRSATPTRARTCASRARCRHSRAPSRCRPCRPARAASSSTPPASGALPGVPCCQASGFVVPS